MNARNAQFKRAKAKKTKKYGGAEMGAVKNGVYKCSLCGNIAEVVHAGGGTLVCCGKPMDQQVENTVEASKEKHIPVVEETDKGVFVKVGSVAHPMEEKHFIQFIELIADGVVYRRELLPGDAPEVLFEVKGKKYEVRAYCNLHGLWKA